MDAKGLALAIRGARKAQGLSVARAGGLAAVSPATVKRWEAGRHLPGRAGLASYLDALGVPRESVYRSALDEVPAGERPGTDRPGAALLCYLRSRRRRLGLTLETVSTATGLSLASLHRYETGERTPPAGVLERLASALEAPPEQFRAFRRLLAGRWPSEASKQMQVADAFEAGSAETHPLVFAHLQAVLDGCDDPWHHALQAASGLVTMGDRASLVELWPRMRSKLAVQPAGIGDSFALRCVVTVAHARPETASRRMGPIAAAIAVVPSGPSRCEAMLALARLAIVAQSWEDAEHWCRRAENEGESAGLEGAAGMAELNRRVAEAYQARKPCAVPGSIPGMGRVGDYTASVARALMADLSGDMDGASEALSEARAHEEASGFGSPAAEAARRRLENWATTRFAPSR